MGFEPLSSVLCFGVFIKHSIDMHRHRLIASVTNHCVGTRKLPNRIHHNPTSAFIVHIIVPLDMLPRHFGKMLDGLDLGIGHGIYSMTYFILSSGLVSLITLIDYILANLLDEHFSITSIGQDMIHGATDSFESVSNFIEVDGG